MYSRQKVAWRVAEAEAELGHPLVYRSIAEVDAFAAHLVAAGMLTYDELGLASGVQSLTAVEADWIENEQTLVMCDADYWLTRYGFVKDEENIIRRFEFRVPQRLLFDIICDLEDRDTSIEIQILKARQLGMSTLTELLITHRIIFAQGINAVIGSSDQTKTALMANMLFLAYDMLPVWMRPKWTRRVESDRGMLVFGHTNSGVSFQHGAQASGIARGTTPTIYHLCISGRTLVRIDDCRVIPIKEITVQHHVISLDGTVVPVHHAWKSPRNAEITKEISVWGTPTSLSCTRDHKVLTAEGWKDASDITEADWLIYPVRPIRSEQNIFMLEFEKWKHSHSGIRAWKPTFELGRLVGLYLAEGCMIYSSHGTPTTVTYAVNEKEEVTVRSWIEAVFSRIRPTNRRKNSKTVIVNLPHRGFAYWLLEHFGARDEKRISDLCWRLGREFCRGLVVGYLAGDGHLAKRDNAVYATSIRVAISIGLRELIASLGYGWSQISYREAGVWYNRNCRACWILVLASDTAEAYRRDLDLPTFNSRREQPPLHWRWNGGLESVALSVERSADGYSDDFYDIEVGQGHTFLSAAGIIHNSEVAGFTNAEQQIEASLFRAVHASPLVFGVLESTGEGDKGWWPDTWRRSKAAWPYTRLCPLFLPWFCGREMYPKSAWLRLRPAPPDWRPNHDTRLHVAKAELYVRSHPLLSRHLGPTWRMPPEQQWFWEVEHEDAKARGTESTFLQEMAGDDEEALQRSSESVFGAPAIIEIESQRKRDYKIYGLSGQSIESSHEPDPSDIDYTPGVERVPLRFVARRGPVYRWELVPLRFDVPLRESETEDANGKLFVFHEPQPNVNYSIGIDTSEGKGQDSTVISVWALGYRGQPDIQVAEFASAYVNHVEAFAFGMVIGVYYSRYMASGVTRWPMPYVSVEQVAAVGDTCQLQMIRMGYPVSCFHRMSRYDAKPTKIARTKRTSTKLGWFTWGWSRPILVTNFVHAAQNGWMQINSPWMIEEMKHFEVKLTAAGKERLEHEEGEHDDRIFSGAMAVFCPHDMDTLSDRSHKRSVESLALPSVDISPFSNAIPAAALREKSTLTLDDLRYTDVRTDLARRL